MSKTINENNEVTLHYVGTLEDGQVFDSSRVKENPFTFVTGTGQVVPGFDKEVIGMKVGETKTFTIEPEYAYGPKNPNAYSAVSKSSFDDDFDFTKGNIVTGNQNGRDFQATVEGDTENHVVLDMNHPLAGKSLTFEVEILSVKDMTV